MHCVYTAYIKAKSGYCKEEASLKEESFEALATYACRFQRHTITTNFASLICLSTKAFYSPSYVLQQVRIESDCNMS